jgi:uncharacterized membrane protein
MSELVVIAFDAEADAASALKRLRAVERAGQIRFEDTAVISKDESGKVNVKNEWSSGAEAGAAIGGALGALSTILFPIGGIVVGAAAGGWIGSKLHEGVDAKFVKDVSASLDPGTSAVLLLMRDWNPAAVASAVSGHRGEILHTNVSDDLVASLRQALNQPS